MYTPSTSFFQIEIRDQKKTSNLSIYFLENLSIIELMKNLLERKPLNLCTIVFFENLFHPLLTPCEEFYVKIILNETLILLCKLLITTNWFFKYWFWLCRILWSINNPNALARWSLKLETKIFHSERNKQEYKFICAIMFLDFLLFIGKNNARNNFADY